MSAVYITVDDAPSEDLSRKVAVLSERDVPALCEGRRLADYRFEGFVELLLDRGVAFGDPNDLYGDRTGG